MTRDDLRLECMRIALAKGGYVLTDPQGVAQLRAATDALTSIVFDEGRRTATEAAPEPNTPAEAPAAVVPDKPEETPAPVQAGKTGRR